MPPFIVFSTILAETPPQLKKNMTPPRTSALPPVLLTCPEPHRYGTGRIHTAADAEFQKSIPSFIRPCLKDGIFIQFWFKPAAAFTRSASYFTYSSSIAAYSFKSSRTSLSG
jgi:hypothetical protein